MQETALVLIRHAHADSHGESGRPCLSGVTDFPLSATGHVEAEKLAVHLARRGERFAVICASPLVRARDTARPLAAAGLGPIVIVEALREIDCGELDGLAIDDVKRRYPVLWAANFRQDDPDFCWPGGESYRVFRERSLGALRSIAARYAGQRVALVTHAGVVSQILGSLAGESAARWEPFRPGNTGVTELLWRGEAGVLTRFDDRAHLAKEG